MPASLQSLGEQAFLNCTGLTGIAVPNGTTRIGKKAFQGCTNLTNVVIPETVERIESLIFMDCSLDMRVWVEKGSKAEEWCRENGYSIVYMDGSVPPDQEDF